MVQSIPATSVTLRTLKPQLGLVAASGHFFPEWSEALPKLTEMESVALDRVKVNFLELLDDPPALENTVKLVVLAPLLDLAGFYRRPFRIATESSLEISLDDENTVIRGRIDGLVVSDFLWLVVIESKRSDFAVNRAIPQALAYMLGNPEASHPVFGLICYGTDFLFLKSQRIASPEYATSRLFSLINPGNELHPVLAILKRLGQLGQSSNFKR